MTSRPRADGNAGAGEAVGPITIVLVDDHRVVRAGLRLLLDQQPGMAVVGEPGDIADVERAVAGHRPDVVVLDVELAPGASLAAIPHVRRLSPRTRVVVVAMHRDPELSRAALGAGASAFVTTDAEPSELVEAIRAAARSATARDAGRPVAGASTLPGPDGLSAREREVLGLIALGHTNGEIAGRLFLSVRTVESHRARIQQKTGRASRAALVAYAREHGIA